MTHGIIGRGGHMIGGAREYKDGWLIWVNDAGYFDCMIMERGDIEDANDQVLTMYATSLYNRGLPVPDHLKTYVKEVSAHD